MAILFVCFCLIGSLELPPSILVTRNPNWSFRDSKSSLSALICCSLVSLFFPGRMASADSSTVAEERDGCGGGSRWASGSARFWLLLVLAMVQQRGKVLAEKGGGAVTAVVERESCTGCLLVGREDHSSSTRTLNVLKTANKSAFLLIGYNQHLLEKSSMNDTKYLAPPNDTTGACQTSE
ncbi:hypothetical protein NC653_027110 [Populus alba x Populus x berolinensis]|uniref:Uncharacterized protein n=1 Tax=Populus alba x Populus x berolinensis TaxID=444605 RepID=A0AAD6M5K2_9ROSI|nr:hypothetical protein NC653_027110 [Populus alba x Populus x berolinensis]